MPLGLGLSPPLSNAKTKTVKSVSGWPSSWLKIWWLPAIPGSHPPTLKLSRKEPLKFQQKSHCISLALTPSGTCLWTNLWVRNMGDLVTQVWDPHPPLKLRVVYHPKCTNHEWCRGGSPERNLGAATCQEGENSPPLPFFSSYGWNNSKIDTRLD